MRRVEDSAPVGSELSVDQPVPDVIDLLPLPGPQQPPGT